MSVLQPFGSQSFFDCDGSLPQGEWECNGKPLNCRLGCAKCRGANLFCVRQEENVAPPCPGPVPLLYNTFSITPHIHCNIIIHQSHPWTPTLIQSWCPVLCINSSAFMQITSHQRLEKVKICNLWRWWLHFKKTNVLPLPTGVYLKKWISFAFFRPNTKMNPLWTIGQ